MESLILMKELSIEELFSIDGGVNWWVVAGGVALVVASVAVSVALPAASPLIAFSLSRTGYGVILAGAII